MRNFLISAGLVVVAFSFAKGQQVPDFEFKPSVVNPAYALGMGPRVKIDEAHYNFHTLATRYNAFAKILQYDGYVVTGNTQVFSSANLRNTSLLVIANAIHPSDTAAWIVPNPSAFTQHEIDEIEKWVKVGGALLLIADHMPFPGAASDLASAFGFTFYNGFATEITSGLVPGSKKELDVFNRTENTLSDHSVTKGKNDNAYIHQVATFTGQAFQIPATAKSLLTFENHYEILLPDTAWRFNAGTKRISAGGFSQGAVLEYGKGRIAVFGEAAMFSSQLKGKNKEPFGLSSPDAKQNQQFLLNLIHWLTKT